MTRARWASRPRFHLLPTVLLTLAIFAVPGVVYAWGRNSSAFEVTDVRLAGTKLVAKQRVLRELRHEYLGENLFRVTGKDVRATLAPYKLIADARVDRGFPGKLTVTVIEHQPAAYALAGGRWYVIAEDGRVVCGAARAADELAARPARGGKDGSLDAGGGAASSAGDEAAADRSAASAEAGATMTAADARAELRSLLLTGPKRFALPLPRIAVARGLKVGAFAHDPVSAETLKVILSLPRSLRRRLATVENHNRLLTLRFTKGPVVTWGDARRTTAKAIALRTVLAAYAGKGKACSRVDVSIPDRTLANPVLK